MNLVEWPDAPMMPNMPTSHCLQVNALISSQCICFYVLRWLLQTCSGGFAESQSYFTSLVNTVINNAFSI